MLETIRAYAQEVSETIGEHHNFRLQHAHLLATLAEQADAALRGEAQAVWLQRLDAEQDNLRAALQWSLANQPLLAVRISGAIWKYWEIRGHIREGRHWLAAACALVEPGNDAPLIVARAYKRAFIPLNIIGLIYHSQGKLDEAQVIFDQALALVARDGTDQQKAVLLENAGMVAQAQRRFAEAKAYYTQSLELKQSIADVIGLAHVFVNQGWLALDQHNIDQSRQYFQTGIRTLADVGHIEGLVEALEGLLGVYAIQPDEHPEAIRLWGATNTLRQTHQLPREPYDEERLRGIVGQLVQLVPNDVFDRLVAEGSALRIEALVVSHAGRERAYGSEPHTLQKS